MTKHNFAHNDHLDQNKGHGGGVHKASGSHLEQGTHGARKQKANGSHLDPVVKGRGPVPSGSHLDPALHGTDKTAVRGGGGLLGHDRADPNAGKASSGDFMTQQPSLANPKRKQKVINPYAHNSSHPKK